MEKDKRVEKIDSATLVISEYGRPSRILVQKSKLLVVSGPLLDVLMTQEN